MVIAGRKKSIAFFIALGAGLVLVVCILYIGWVWLDWRKGILLFLGVILLAFIVAGVVLNTIFLVREIRRNAQHDAFINAVTHELKTPVASIRLYLQTLQTHTVDEQKRKEFYAIMLEDSDRLLTTIEQVLRTGRMGLSGAKPNRVRLDLNALIRDCVESTVKLHQVPREALQFVPSPDVTVYGDREEIETAVSNLIDNAVKYSGKALKISIQTKQLDDRFVCVRVRDQGPGIEKTELKRIFGRFYRAQGQIAARVKGTGLGLFIVRSVAKRHGGRAWAESEGPGRGSTFVLQLPIAR
jgi:signal transduction histidine kinase